MVYKIHLLRVPDIDKLKVGHNSTPQENFSPSRGILKMARVSPHFSSSHGIPRDGEMFSWRGWGMVFLSLWSSGSCLGAPPPQENFSSSRGIPRDEEKWGETLAIFKIPRDGEKFSWGGRGVVKSHEEKKIPRDFSPIYANAAPS